MFNYLILHLSTTLCHLDFSEILAVLLKFMFHLKEQPLKGTKYLEFYVLTYLFDLFWLLVRAGRTYTDVRTGPDQVLGQNHTN